MNNDFSLDLGSATPIHPLGLTAPLSYLNAEDDIKFTICNGCGAANAKFKFVPDSIWGLSITEACFIHDWMYEFGETSNDKLQADATFLLNMITLVERGNRFLRLLRRLRALEYFGAVRDFGNDAFFTEAKIKRTGNRGN